MIKKINKKILLIIVSVIFILAATFAIAEGPGLYSIFDMQPKPIGEVGEVGVCNIDGVFNLTGENGLINFKLDDGNENTGISLFNYNHEVDGSHAYIDFHGSDSDGTPDPYHGRIWYEQDTGLGFVGYKNDTAFNPDLLIRKDGTIELAGDLDMKGNDIINVGNGGSDPNIREYKQSIRSMGSGVGGSNDFHNFKMGELEFGDPSHQNIIISGRVHAQSGTNFGVSKFEIMIRTSDSGAQAVRYSEKYFSDNLPIRILPYYNFAGDDKEFVLGFTSHGRTIHNYAWDITIYQRDYVSHWINEDDEVELNTAGLQKGTLTFQQHGI